MMKIALCGNDRAELEAACSALSGFLDELEPGWEVVPVVDWRQILADIVQFQIICLAPPLWAESISPLQMRRAEIRPPHAAGLLLCKWKLPVERQHTAELLNIWKNEQAAAERARALQLTAPSGPLALPVGDVLCFFCKKRKFFAHTEKADFPLKMTAAELERQMAPFYFFHCFASIWVNLEWVEQINPPYALLKSGEKLSVAQQRVSKFRKAFREYWKA